MVGVVLGVVGGVVAGLLVLGVALGLVLGLAGAVLGGVVLGVVVLGVVVPGLLVDGVPVVGPVVVGVVGLPVAPVVGAVVVGSPGVPDDVVPSLRLPGAAAVHGVAGVQVVLHGVPACRGLPTGIDGRALDRDVPSVRPSCGLEDSAEAGGCDSAVLRDPVGTKNHAAATAATTAAATPSFRRGRRRRLCRAPNFRACRPRRNCLTRKPFTPRPFSSLPNTYASIEAHVERPHCYLRSRRILRMAVTRSAYDASPPRRVGL